MSENEFCSKETYLQALKERDEWRRKYSELFDKTQGTPCEQIRHEQELTALREERDRALEKCAALEERLDREVRGWRRSAALRSQDEKGKGGSHE